MWNSELKIYAIAVAVGLFLISTTPNSLGFTLPSDVRAISSLYKSLGFPPLQGWVPTNGDPCATGWQGVQCESYNIIGIVLNNLAIRGQLSLDLQTFSSIEKLDLSCNYIWGNIPLHLPPTLKFFSLKSNVMNGLLTDAFQQLKDLSHLDLSDNRLGSPLPPSMVNLSSLSILHLQNNYLTGALDVLQNLPIIDLDIDNNFFSGPIPPKMLSIPNFRRKGNLLNTTSLELSPLPSSTFKSSSKKAVWFAIFGFLFLVLLALGLCMFVSRWSKQQSLLKVGDRIISYMLNVFSSYQYHHKENETPWNDNERNDPSPKPKVGKKKMEIASKNPSPTLTPPPLTEIVVKPVPVSTTGTNISIIADLAEAVPISSLYTNGFSQENLIGRGMLGMVYRAHLPNGKLLAVRRLEDADLMQWSDKDFMDLVSNVSKLQNENIVRLVGFCCEHGERLLVYEHYKNGILHEALHLDEDIHKKLSWKTRVNMALQVAKALEYLHEAHVVHQNLKSANIMLDEELNACVFDCGLAPLIPSSYISQFQSSGYGAPELESGSSTFQTDVYSFGVVMLELLTGRKAHHRSKTRGEQYLVKWAFPRLHDIEALSRIVDPSLDAAHSSKSVSRFADIISLCIQAEPEFRPPMSEIVQYLEHMTKMKH
ncbi:hypothetical protein R6Q57_003594 [Mikania cordata]